MNCRFALLGLFGGWLLVLAGCASPSDPHLGSRDPLRVFEGAEFAVALPVTPGDGHGWRLVQQPNPHIARVLRAEYLPPTPRKKRGHDIWTCQARNRGTTRIIWHYLPRGDTNHPPARVHLVTVQVR